MEIPDQEYSGLLERLQATELYVDQCQKMEEALLESEQKLEAIFDSVRIGIALLDTSGRILKINKIITEVSGYTGEEVVGKKFSYLKMFPEQTVQRIISDLTRVIAGQVLPPFTVEVYAKNGAKIFVEVLTSLLKKGDKISGIIFTMRDISERIKLEELRTDFVNIVSHELRVPLASIKQAIYLVNSGIAGAVNADQKKYLGIGLQSIDRLNNIINSLLDEAKMEAGKVVLDLELVNINEIVLEEVKTFTLQAQNKGIRIEKKLDLELPLISVDSNRISEVAANLLSNAIKFTPQNGEIVVSTSVSENNPNFIEVRVRDFGEGIAREDMDKLFKKYQQLDTAISKKAGGTGLGLVLCKEIVELHRGKIRVESEGKGKGSVFIFTLPKDSKLRPE